MNVKPLIALLSIILTVIFIFGFIVVSSMNQTLSEITTYNSSLSAQIGTLSAEIDSMTFDIQNMLNEQDSMITDYTISYGEPNTDTLTCDVTVNITPKTYTADTTVYLYIDDIKTAMTLKGNAYSATVSVPIAIYESLSVTFDQSGINKTELLPEVIDVGEQILDRLSVEPMFDFAYQIDSITLDGSLYYSFHSEFGEKAVSAQIVAKMDGTEVWSMNVENPESEQDIPLTHTFNCEFEDDILIYMEVTDSSGLMYRRILFAGYCTTGTDSIYDANGNVVFER